MAITSTFGFPTIFFPPPPSPTRPGDPGPISGERSDAGAPDVGTTLAEGPELLKRAYARPDYQRVVKLYTPVIARMLKDDPEAFKNLNDLFKRYGVSIDSGERVPLLLVVCAVAFVAGAAWGAITG